MSTTTAKRIGKKKMPKEAICPACGHSAELNPHNERYWCQNIHCGYGMPAEFLTDPDKINLAVRHHILGLAEQVVEAEHAKDKLRQIPEELIRQAVEEGAPKMPGKYEAAYLHGNRSTTFLNAIGLWKRHSAKAD